MIDFRYEVRDPARAAPLFDRQVKPYLLDVASGARMAVPTPPKVGPLRTTYPPQADRTYFILFANPGRYIQPGSEVAIVVGDIRLDGLVVE